MCVCIYMCVLWTASKQFSSYLFPRVATRGGRPERTRYIIGMSSKRGSSENGVWNNPYCPVGHALQRFKIHGTKFPKKLCLVLAMRYRIMSTKGGGSRTCHWPPRIRMYASDLYNRIIRRKARFM